MSAAKPTPTTPKAAKPTSKPLTLEEAVAVVLKALNLDPRDVSQLDIAATGRIRVFGVDRSLRNKRFEPLERHKRDAQNRIIE